MLRRGALESICTFYVTKRVHLLWSKYWEQGTEGGEGQLKVCQSPRRGWSRRHDWQLRERARAGSEEREKALRR